MSDEGFTWRGWTVHQDESGWSVTTLMDVFDHFQSSELRFHTVPVGTVNGPPLATLDLLLAELNQHLGVPSLPQTSIGYVAGTARQHIHHPSFQRGAAAGVVLGSYGDEAFVHYNYEIMRNGSAIKSTQPLRMALAALSATSRETVRRLDKASKEYCSYRFNEMIHRVTDGAPPTPVTPRFGCFLSYRRTHLREAKLLQATVEGFARGAYFDVFLDIHDLLLGEWEQQLSAAIQAQDLFLVLESEDYGRDGSYSRTEFELAMQLGKRIAWVGLPGVQSVVSGNLHRYQGCPLDEDTTSDSSSTKIASYLALCARSLGER